MTEENDEIRNRALNVLRDIQERWFLTADSWTDVAEVLGALDPGLDLADPDQLAALAAATSKLEVLAPERLKAVEQGDTPATAPVRERANRLIHALAQPRQEDTDAAERAVE